MLGKKIIRGFFCVLLLIVGVTTGKSTEAEGQKNEMSVSEDSEIDVSEEEPSLSLYATSAVLMDADSGRVLYGKASDVPMAMASTTKIMTCILVLENGNPEDVVSVSSYAASMPKVKLYVHKGEEYRVGDLLYSLMLESHNDTAVVLAEYIGRKLLLRELGEQDTDKYTAEYMAEYTTEESVLAVEAFAGLMNQKAEELGCKDTWFITPNGLDATQTITQKNGEAVQKEHHTTAEELAKIMAYCIKQSPQKEAFLQITRTANYSFASNGRSFSCVNHNAFLNMMEGALSGKTGFTNKAGYCYVGALERDGRTYVVALLACGWPNNKSYKWSDTRELMAYGVENYFYHSLTEGRAEAVENAVCAITVEHGRTAVLGQPAFVEVKKTDVGKGLEGLLLKEGEEVKVSLYQKKKLEAPVPEGMVVGYVCYAVDDTIYRVEDIITTRGVERITRAWCMEQIWMRFLLGKEDYILQENGG